jgi:hypothetical protein
VYVTANGDQWLVLDVPRGVIAPPTIGSHQPTAGAVTFYWADCYKLPVPAEAAAAARLTTTGPCPSPAAPAPGAER